MRPSQAHLIIIGLMILRNVGEQPSVDFNTAALGAWGQEWLVVLDASRISRYARVTGDRESAAARGRIAPPVFAAVPIWDALNAATARVVPAEIADRAVHVTQDIRLRRPLAAETEVVARVAAVGVFGRRSGAEVAYRAELRRAGELLAEQWITEIYRGVWPNEEAGEEPPRLAPAMDAADDGFRIEVDVPPGITSPYAEVSGDDFAIHLDDEFARSVGLPGTIVQGLCTLALASNSLLATTGHGVEDVERLAVRFSRPVRPGSVLAVHAWHRAPDEIAFVARAQDDTVLRDGTLRLR